jgi:hypothetical protein
MGEHVTEENGEGFVSFLIENNNKPEKLLVIVR